MGAGIRPPTILSTLMGICTPELEIRVRVAELESSPF
jgi:hypothetical protein